MWSPICDLFNPPKRKAIMRSTAFVIYKTPDGNEGKLKVVSRVFRVISPEKLIGELVRDIVTKLYEQNCFISELRVVTKEEWEAKNWSD